MTEVTGPTFSPDIFSPAAFDLTRQHQGQPIGERIIVSGQGLDESNLPVANTVIEIWQASAAGRYAHDVDHSPQVPGRVRAFP